MAWGMSASGMCVAHLACLLARRSRPYAAEIIHVCATVTYLNKWVF